MWKGTLTASFWACHPRLFPLSEHPNRSAERYLSNTVRIEASTIRGRLCKWPDLAGSRTVKHFDDGTAQEVDRILNFIG
jgi:hypothetical protein